MHNSSDATKITKNSSLSFPFFYFGGVMEVEEPNEEYWKEDGKFWKWWERHVLPYERMEERTSALELLEKLEEQ